jgi:Spy/CpxP family protein refolding chaperone
LKLRAAIRAQLTFALHERKSMNQKKFLAITLTLVVFASASSVLAQNSTTAKRDAVSSSAAVDASQATSDDFVNLLRKDIRSQKKQIIAENMGLTDAEAEKFWPVYDQYAAELSKIYDAKLALLNDYANNYGSMTGDQAESYIRKRADVEQSIMQLRLKYMPAFRKVLSGRETALFYQLDWRLGLAIDVQLVQVPLINQ